MKKCSNCGKEIKDHVKFCNFCGQEQQGNVTEIVTETVVSHDEKPSIQGEGIHHTNQSNQHQQFHQETQNNQQQPYNQGPIINQQAVNQLTNRSKNYFSYINKNIKQPIIGKSNQDGYFGLINYVLICVFTGLAISHAIGKVIGITGYSESSFPMFLQITLLLLCSQLVNVVTVYLLSGKIFNNNMSFMDTFDRMYAPIGLAIYVSFAALLLSFISAIGIGLLFFICLILTFFLTSVTYVANLWVTNNQSSKRNTFYWTMGAIIFGGLLQLLVSIVLSDILGTSMMNIIQQMIDSSVSKFF